MPSHFKILSYGLAGLGAFFLIIDILLIFYSVESSGATTVTYPYRPFAIPSLVTGLILLGSGIAGFWIDYLKFEKKQEKDLLVPKNEVKEKEKQDFDIRINKISDSHQYTEKPSDIKSPQPIGYSSIEQEPLSSTSGGVLVSILVLVICALLAVVLWNYEGGYNIMGIHVSLYPYRPYASIFVIGALIGLGGLLYSLATGSKGQETNQVPNIVQNVHIGAGTSQILCGSCGTMNDIDAVFCKKCANRFR